MWWLLGGLVASWAVVALKRTVPRESLVDGDRAEAMWMGDAWLVKLPADVMCLICSRLEARDVARLGGVCTMLRGAELDFRQSGQVVPVYLDLELAASDPQHVYDIDATVRTITKNARRGMSHVLCRQPVDVYSCYWEIRLDCFTGRRCEVGVVVSGAVTSSGIDKARAWYIDCWGRKVHKHTMEEYGGKMSAGAVVGVLYDTREASLTYFQDGRSMGVAYTQVRADHGRLCAFVSIPSWENERVTLLDPRASTWAPVHCAAMHARQPAWCRMPHPDDGKLVVKTFLNLAFVVPCDPSLCTVWRLKQLLAPQFGYPAMHIALRCGGVALSDPDALLEHYGVRFGTNGSQIQDVLMYVPHEVS